MTGLQSLFILVASNSLTVVEELVAPFVDVVWQFGTPQKPFRGHGSDSRSTHNGNRFGKVCHYCGISGPVFTFFRVRLAKQGDEQIQKPSHERILLQPQIFANGLPRFWSNYRIDVILRVEINHGIYREANNSQVSINLIVILKLMLHKALIKHLEAVLVCFSELELE